MDKKEIKHILQGTVDMHLHSSPDIILRKMNDIELAQAAFEADMSGIVLKCHAGLTADRAALVRKIVPGLHVYGGLVLNRMAGGLNPDAVETALKMGAKEIWMPTIHAENHLKGNKKDISRAIRIADDDGHFAAPLYPILEMIGKADAILGTGHISVAETVRLVALARKMGVKKILVTHPEWELTLMPIDIQKSLAAQGVFFERCFYAINSAQAFPIEEMAQQIREVGPESTVISTDFGQPDNDYPVEGLYRYVTGLLAQGLTQDCIDQITRRNPKALLDIS